MLHSTYLASIAYVLICVIFVQLISPSAGARILGFFPSQSKSNLLIHCSVADALANAGHNVTVIGTMPNVYQNTKYTYIHLNVPSFDTSYINVMINRPQSILKTFPGLVAKVTHLSNETLWHPDMQQFLKQHTSGSFDLMILGYFINDFHMGLAAHFKCPLIVTVPVQPTFMINSLVGNPYEVAYVPSLFGGLIQPMNYWQRVRNFLVSIFTKYGLHTIMQHYMQPYYDYNFPADRYPSFDEVKKNVSLILTNHHFSQGPIRPYVPALVEIGGIQIKEKPDALPADLANILDNAKQGAIFFSLGSNVQGSNLSKAKANIMFNALSKLPYKVFWKWGDSDFPGTSANIVYKSWLPQNDILAHPNVKLFITHCGQGSVVESQYHGVPMLGIPLFGDQPANAAHMKNEGFGIAIDYISLTETNFKAAILEVIENPSYTQAVQKFSKLYRDRPMTPRQTVVFWVEYVLRHHGAKHLQSPAVHMNSLQLMSLDVIAFLLAVLAIVMLVVIKICKFLCCRSRKVTANITHDSRKKKTN